MAPGSACHHNLAPCSVSSFWREMPIFYKSVGITYHDNPFEVHPPFYQGTSVFDVSFKTSRQHRNNIRYVERN